MGGGEGPNGGEGRARPIPAGGADGRELRAIRAIRTIRELRVIRAIRELRAIRAIRELSPGGKVLVPPVGRSDRAGVWGVVLSPA